MDCNKTIDFMQEKARLCESMKHPDDCWTKCPLGGFCLDTASESSMRDGITALQKWSDEHADNDRKSFFGVRWISVIDRLPEDGEPVLVVVSGRPRKRLLLTNSLEIAEHYSDGWFFEAYPHWEDPKVSYWLPLPEPPEE